MNMTASSLWTDAAAILRSRLSPEAFRRWIAPLEPLSLVNEVLTLGVANDFFQSWLLDNYMPLLRAAVHEAAGRLIEVRFVAAAASSSLPMVTEIAAPVSQERRPVDAELNPSYTFESFVVGQNNEFAHAAALAVSQQPGTAYNPLFIYGGTGLGKTHLMQAIGSSLLRSGRARRVIYLSAEAFANEFIHTIMTKNFVRFRKKFRTADALLIDDVHFLERAEKTQEEFFHTFNQIYNARKQIILSSDRPSTEMKSLEARLVSRFEWGSVVELLPPDYETRIAILRKKAQAQQLNVSDEILAFVAQRIRANVRRLEGALVRVASFASLSGRSLAIPDVESLLQDLLLEEGRQAISIALVQRRVAAHFDILLSDMTSKRRPQEIAFPRQVAMFLCRRLTPSSFSAIGGAFGGRDHGTVLHACRIVQQRLAKDSGLRQAIALLTKQLG